MTTINAAEQSYLTIAQAALLADRSKTVIRRWIMEGWIEKSFVIPGRNGTWLLDRADFESKLPNLLEEMGKRKGGRGNKATDAHGQARSVGK